MSTFRIRTYAQWIAIIGIFVVLFAGLGTIVLLRMSGISNSSSPINLIVLIAMVVAGYAIVTYGAMSHIEVQLDRDAIGIYGLRKNVRRKRAQKVIQWSNIDHWVVEPDPKYEMFRIVLKNGQSFSFRHKNKHDGKDDYKNFLFAFRNEVDARNRSVPVDGSKIIKEKTIYEGQWRYPLVVLSIILLLSPMLYFLVPADRHPNFMPMFAVYPAAMFILYKVFSSTEQR